VTRQLEGKTALITGASRGLGLALARAFAQAGARCILTARDRDALGRTVAEIRAGGGDAIAIPLDLERLEGVEGARVALSSATDRLDILVANAALGGGRGPLVEYPLTVWKQLFQVNVHANLMLLAAAHPLLRRSDAGRVIFVSTGVARKWKANTGAYAVSKAAFEAMAGIYAVEVAGTPIKINIVNPGPTRTEMRAQAFPQEDPRTLKTPESIAPLFLELASPACVRHGECINADEWLALSASAS